MVKPLVTILLFTCCMTRCVFDYDYVEEQPIIVIIPSYNNELLYKGNLDSVFAQDYKNFKVIYINDASTDKTGQCVDDYVRACGMSDKVTIIHNSYNRKALMNIYQAVHRCPDNALIIILDGDDKFAHEYVLKKFNRMHADGTTWLSYAQYINWPPWAAVCNKIPIIGYAAQTPQEIVATKNYRWCYQWFWSGLRGFNAWFFKCVKLESLFLDTPPYLGKLLPIMYDAAILWPMMELGGAHTRFIPDILLTRNMTPLNDFHSSADEVKKAVRRVLRTQKVYPTLESPCDRATLHGRCANHGVTALIFSDNNPYDAARTLELLMNTCSGITSWCVVYSALTRCAHNRYALLASEYPEVTFLAEDQTDSISERLKVYLVSRNEQHLFITDDQQSCVRSLHLSACVDQLERTYAYAFYFGIGIDDFAAQPDQPIALRACEQLDGDLYAWQFKCWQPYTWKQHALTQTLYRKSDLITVLQKKDTFMLKSLIASWQNVVVPQEKIGLFFADAYAMVSTDLVNR